MTSASKQIITRCPKCGTAFRVTPTQLQSAKGAVRCGSCLHVFKAQEYIVASPQPAASTAAVSTTTENTKPTEIIEPFEPINTQAKTPTPTAVVTAPQKTIAPLPSISKPASVTEPAILSAIKPLSIDLPTPSPIAQATTPQPTKPVVRVIDKSSLAQADDILISDDMDDHKEDSSSKNYEFDSFMDIDLAPKSEVSLFERKIRDKDEEDTTNDADESWAEMLIDEEDDDTPQLGILKPKTEEQLADDELTASYAVNTEVRDDQLKDNQPSESYSSAPAPTPGLVFSLIGEPEEKPQQNDTSNDEFIISDELSRIPSNQGFTQVPAAENTGPLLDPSIFETPEENADDNSPKRQVKTQPKIRAYDGSRTALLMNIMPAPIELTAKRMRRWYQRKLWPSLSFLALIALIVQVGWFKFDYFSRAEPYRTGYLFLCPYLGCEVPSLVDTSRIVASNLVVREIPETPGALAVDVMIINNAPFEQPYPDLILVFTNIDEKPVASRRFAPKEYLGGEVAGQDLMPQNRKVHISLDMLDPGPEAVNYHIDIPR